MPARQTQLGERDEYSLRSPGRAGRSPDIAVDVQPHCNVRLRHRSRQHLASPLCAHAFYPGSPTTTHSRQLYTQWNGGRPGIAHKEKKMGGRRWTCKEGLALLYLKIKH